MNYMKIKLITLRKLIYFILTTILFTSCVNHRYKITDLERPRNKETLHLSLFTIGGLVPIFNNLDKDNVCPNSKIRSINLHDSVINTTICTVSLFLVCPHTVGIVCE
jgi:hypothetical protein